VSVHWNRLSPALPVPMQVRTAWPVAVFTMATRTSPGAAAFMKYEIAVPRGATSPDHHLSPGTSVTFMRSVFQSTASRGWKSTASLAAFSAVNCCRGVMSSRMYTPREWVARIKSFSRGCTATSSTRPCGRFGMNESHDLPSSSDTKNPNSVGA
jgi:hypothetical protein